MQEVGDNAGVAADLRGGLADRQQVPGRAEQLFSVTLAWAFSGRCEVKTSPLTSRVGYGRALMWPLGGACRIGAEKREQAVVVIAAG